MVGLLPRINKISWSPMEGCFMLQWWKERSPEVHAWERGKGTIAYLHKGKGQIDLAFLMSHIRTRRAHIRSVSVNYVLDMPILGNFCTFKPTIMYFVQSWRMSDAWKLWLQVLWFNQGFLITHFLRSTRGTVWCVFLRKMRIIPDWNFINKITVCSTCMISGYCHLW